MKIYIWGTGKIADEVMDKCEFLENYEICGFIDNSSEKQGTLFWGYTVYSISILETSDFDRIVILTDSFSSIKEQILSFSPEIHNKIENKFFFYREAIFSRYRNTKDEAIKSLISYIEKNDLSIFNYDFAKKYENLSFEVFFDTGCNMFYVLREGKRLYFPSEYDRNKVIGYYKSILLEQDNDSPHKYCSSDFTVNSGDTILDVGSAEGAFTLDNIDRVSYAYVIEADMDWVKALTKTFEPYSDKVKIMNAFASSMDCGKHRRIDSLLMGKSINFIKMDIEGCEWDALVGSENILRNSDGIKAVICCYHADEDEILLTTQMKNYGFSVAPGEGYMWFPYTIKQKNVSSRFVHGVIRCYK